MSSWIPKVTPARMLHTTATLQSQYRGPFIHGTLREWALRMIEKDVSKWNRRKKRVPPDVVKLMGEADAIVESVKRRDAKRSYMPRGASLRLMESADQLLQEGASTDVDRRDRLREALQLYYRASERANGTMPVIGSRIWGTTLLLEHRIRKTSDKLHKAEMRFIAKPRVARDDVGWGMRVQKEPLPDTLTQHSSDPEDIHAESNAGVQYKTTARPPLRRLPPSAVERARMPLLQAFPGIGTVGDTQLGVNHALLSASGFLGTHVASRTSHDDGALNVPRTPHTPPTTSQAGNLRWIKHRERNERLATQYFMRAAAPLAPPPLALSKTKSSSSPTAPSMGLSLSAFLTSLSEVPTPIPTLEDDSSTNSDPSSPALKSPYLSTHAAWRSSPSRHTKTSVNPAPVARHGRRTPYVARKAEVCMIRFPAHGCQTS